MNDLLEYISEVIVELQDIYHDLNCPSLCSEHNHLVSIAEGLKEKVKYYQGFAYKEDKEPKYSYFLKTDLSDDEWEEFIKTDMYKKYFKD